MAIRNLAPVRPRYYIMTIVTDHGHNMTEHRTIPAGEFKAKCLKLMDEVRDTGEELIITKHGKPVAKLAPVEGVGREKPKTLFGCMKGSIEILGDIVDPVETGWEDIIKHWDELHEKPPKDDQT